MAAAESDVPRSHQKPHPPADLVLRPGRAAAPPRLHHRRRRRRTLNALRHRLPRRRWHHHPHHATGLRLAGRLPARPGAAAGRHRHGRDHRQVTSRSPVRIDRHLCRGHGPFRSLVRDHEINTSRKRTAMRRLIESVLVSLDGVIEAPSRKRTAMRRLIESVLVSLDGVIEAPERWANFDAEDAAWSMEQLGNYDAFVMGRVTYEKFFANWG